MEKPDLLAARRDLAVVAEYGGKQLVLYDLRQKQRVEVLTLDLDRAPGQRIWERSSQGTTALALTQGGSQIYVGHSRGVVVRYSRLR